jgi:hypothetical protein
MGHEMVTFYEKLSEPRQIPKQEDHPLSAIRDSLFNIFAAILPTGICSSIRNDRKQQVLNIVTVICIYALQGMQSASSLHRKCWETYGLCGFAAFLNSPLKSTTFGVKRIDIKLLF